MVSGMEMGEVSPNHHIPTPGPPDPEHTLPQGLSQVTFHAMGTTVTLLLPEQRKVEGAAIARDLFERWEQALSRFRPDSELSYLNRYAGTRVIVGELLFTVLRQALAAAQATNGVYDPTLLPQLAQLGYDRSFETLTGPLPQTSYAGEPGGGWQKIALDPVIRSVLLPPGVQLDFGGIAKGMAVDAALKALRKAGINTIMVNAGGDLAVHGLPPQTDAWLIGLPITAGHAVTQPTTTVEDTTWLLPLHHGALATSGISKRRWQQGQQQRHHLLDPRTGLPVDNGLWSVTVVASTCQQAEVAAKVAFILGREQGQAFLTLHGLAGLFVNADGSWQPTQLWPTQRIRRDV